jgi:hypothetical protein
MHLLKRTCHRFSSKLNFSASRPAFISGTFNSLVIVLPRGVENLGQRGINTRGRLSIQKFMCWISLRLTHPLCWTVPVLLIPNLEPLKLHCLPLCSKPSMDGVAVRPSAWCLLFLATCHAAFTQCMSKFPMVGCLMLLPFEPFFLLWHHVARYFMVQIAFIFKYFKKKGLFKTGHEHVFKHHLACLMQ